MTKKRVVNVLSWTSLLAGIGIAILMVLPASHTSARLSPSSKPLTQSSHTFEDSLPQGVATRNIEDLRVGDRVLAHNPRISDDQRLAWLEPDWSKCLCVKLEMDQATGDILHIEMIRPIEWFANQSVEPGARIFLDVAEMGAWGYARVISVSETPRVKPGRGQVVTATFSHPPSTNVLDVTIEGSDKPISVTDNHLFWSVDRQEFVPIGEMEIGELVQTFQGSTRRIEAKLPKIGPQLVYNVEVYGEHVYFVGEDGCLAHNQYIEELSQLYKKERPDWIRTTTNEKGIAVQEFWTRDIDNVERWLPRVGETKSLGLAADHILPKAPVQKALQKAVDQGLIDPTNKQKAIDFLNSIDNFAPMRFGYNSAKKDQSIVQWIQQNKKARDVSPEYLLQAAESQMKSLSRIKEIVGVDLPELNHFAQQSRGDVLNALRQVHPNLNLH